jgi:hypothetical protein
MSFGLTWSATPFRAYSVRTVSSMPRAVSDGSAAKPNLTTESKSVTTLSSESRECARELGHSEKQRESYAALRGSHIAGHRGGVSARWRRAGVAAAALALPLAASGIAAAPASAAGGYIVTHTIPVGSGPSGVAVDHTARTAYVANGDNGTVSVIDEATNVRRESW